MEYKNIITTDKSTQTEYLRPMLTFTERLTKDEISIYLEDYKRVKNIYDIKIGALIRYFIRNPDDSNSLLFRIGGEVYSTSHIPEYISLRSGYVIWSVYTENAIFFMKLSNDELKREFNDMLFEKNEKIKQLLQQHKILKEKNMKLEYELSKFKNK